MPKRNAPGVVLWKRGLFTIGMTGSLMQQNRANWRALASNAAEWKAKPSIKQAIMTIMVIVYIAMTTTHWLISSTQRCGASHHLGAYSGQSR